MHLAHQSVEAVVEGRALAQPRLGERAPADDHPLPARRLGQRRRAVIAGVVDEHDGRAGILERGADRPGDDLLLVEAGDQEEQREAVHLLRAPTRRRRRSSGASRRRAPTGTGCSPTGAGRARRHRVRWPWPHSASDFPARCTRADRNINRKATATTTARHRRPATRAGGRERESARGHAARDGDQRLSAVHGSGSLARLTPRQPVTVAPPLSVTNLMARREEYRTSTALRVGRRGAAAEA